MSFRRSSRSSCWFWTEKAIKPIGGERGNYPWCGGNNPLWGDMQAVLGVTVVQSVKYIEQCFYLVGEKVGLGQLRPDEVVLRELFGGVCGVRLLDQH